VQSFQTLRIGRPESISAMAMFRQSRLVILLKPADFRLAVRNTNPDVGKVLLNEARNARTASSLAALSAATRSISFCRYRISLLRAAILRGMFMVVNQSRLRSMSEIGDVATVNAPPLDSEAKQHLASFDCKGDYGENDGQSYATYKALSHYAVGE